jgi:hypothetical protein
MVICAGIKRDGGRCTATVEPPQSYCWWHDPANSEKRRRAASKGGKGKASRELTSIKKRLLELAGNVLDGAVDRSDAAVVSQVLNVYLRAISTEMKVREQMELIERVEELERRLSTNRRNNHNQKGRKYGG